MKILFVLSLCMAFSVFAADVIIKPLEEILFDYHTSQEKQEGWSELAYAIEKGYIAAADKMIRNGADPNVYFQDESKTPFTLAIELGNLELIQRMIDYKANVNLAVKNVYDSCMPQVKVEEFPDRVCAPDTYSPLMVAIQAKKPEVAALLITNGADPFFRTHFRYQPIHLSIRHQLEDTLKKLLDKGANPNAKDAWGYAPLHYCAFLPESPLVGKMGELLLERGANANQVIDSPGYRFAPLHLSALNGHGDLTQFLLMRRAEVDIEDSEGATPLWRAVSSPIDSWEVVRGLIRANADVNRINRGVQIEEARDNLGTSILTLAILNQKIEIAELLLKSGAAVDLVDAYGKTALMYAVVENNQEAVELLLKYKADPNHQGRIKRSSLDIALNLEHHDIFGLLIEAHTKQLYR